MDRRTVSHRYHTDSLKQRNFSIQQEYIIFELAIHTYFICHVSQYKKAAKKLMWTYKLKYIYNNSNNNANKLKNYLQWVRMKNIGIGIITN